MNNWSLYLDDERNPKTDRQWIVARTIKDAENLVLQKGCPSYISFDHDIDENGTGLDFAKWLIDQDLNGVINISVSFEFNVHSANPTGAENIRSLMTNYLKHKFMKVEE